MRISDWSSDVCSSDLLGAHRVEIGLAGAVGDVELDEAPRAHVRHAAETQSLERMMDRLALRVEHPRLERHIDIHFHGADLLLWRAGRWARLCPRITSGARGAKGHGDGENAAVHIANQSHLSCCESFALSLNGYC